VAAPARAGLDPDSSGHCRALATFLDREVPVGRWVVVFDALPGEVDLRELVEAHPDPGGRFALTRTPETGRTLTVHRWDGPRERHRYGYDQPTADAPVVDDDTIGAVLVPALAFDRRGTRLGRGAGYYDRFLARLDPDVLRIGITGGYVVDRLPAEAHDVVMTHLATADGVLAVPLGPGRAGSDPPSGSGGGGP